MRSFGIVTWVIGMAGHLAGAVLVGDVRVTFRKEGKVVERLDLLQKIHQVESNMAIGFAGSVHVGFQMVDEFRDFAACRAARGFVPPGRTIWDWWRIARRNWTQLDPHLQKLGCSLIIAGAQPRRGVVNPNLGFALRSPDFAPQSLTRVPLAIGSGDNVEAYRAQLKQSGLAWLRQYEKFDLTKQAPLAPLGTILAETVEQNPAKGISPHLHLCIVRCNDFIWENNDRVLGDGTTWTMPPVADDWASFSSRAQTLGLTAEAACADDTEPRHAQRGTSSAGIRQL